MTNSSWFAGDFPILALKIHGPRTASAPGKPKCLVTLERGFTRTNLLNKEFDSVYCSSLKIKSKCNLYLLPHLEVIFDDIFVDWITELHEERLKTFSE